MIKEKEVRQNWHVSNRGHRVYKKVPHIDREVPDAITGYGHPLNKKDWHMGVTNGGIMIVVNSGDK